MTEDNGLLAGPLFKLEFDQRIKTMGKKKYHPGEVVEISGQYKNPSTGTEVTCVKGKRFPPAPEKGQTYILTDKTKHKK